MDGSGYDKIMPWITKNHRHIFIEDNGNMAGGGHEGTHDPATSTGNDVADAAIVYHRTSPEAAAQIARTGRFLSKENTDWTYASNKLQGQAESFGTSVVTLKVPKKHLMIQDEFPSGEKYFAVSNKKLSKRNIVSVK